MDHGGDIVVMLHPDYQYDPRLIPHLVDFIKNGYFDVMLGSRIKTRQEALEGGMPPYKYYANRALTLFQNLATGQNLGEWHSGMRVYSRKVLKAVPFRTFSNDFIFDTQMLLAAIKKGFRIGDIPVPVRYFSEASSINFMRSLNYGFLTILETLKYRFLK
ncbi:MAG: glycosyltransferase family 2 protein [Candidatus Shapirobacteria bacterium]